MGDYFDTNYDQIRATTKFEIKADFFKIQMEAWDRTNTYFDETVVDEGSVVADSDACTVYESDTPETFHERIKGDVLSQFADLTTVIDEKSATRLDQLEEFIDSMID